MYYCLLQGQELEALRAATPYQHIVYCGDGANDLCPALALAPGDVVLAREVRNCHMQFQPIHLQQTSCDAEGRPDLLEQNTVDYEKIKHIVTKSIEFYNDKPHKGVLGMTPNRMEEALFIHTQSVYMGSRAFCKLSKVYRQCH